MVSGNKGSSREDFFGGGRGGHDHPQVAEKKTVRNTNGYACFICMYSSFGIGNFGPVIVELFSDIVRSKLLDI